MKKSLLQRKTPVVLSEELAEEAYEKIFALFRKLQPSISQTVLDSIRQQTHVLTLEKRHVLLDYGEICRHCYFLVRGLVSSSFILEGREKTVWFMTTGDIVIAVESFYTQTPSEEKVTVLKPTVCLALPWEALERIYEDHIEFNVIGRRLTEYYYRQALARTKWLHHTVRGRYESLARDYPNVVRQVSNTELASFLGIARETLSRIRRELSRAGRL